MKKRLKNRSKNKLVIIIVIIAVILFILGVAFGLFRNSPQLGPTDDGTPYLDSILCKDSDGGVFILTAGVVSWKRAGGWDYYPDKCLANLTIQEFYCSKGPQSVTMTCPVGTRCVIGFAKLKAGHRKNRLKAIRADDQKLSANKQQNILPQWYKDYLIQKAGAITVEVKNPKGPEVNAHVE